MGVGFVLTIMVLTTVLMLGLISRDITVFIVEYYFRKILDISSYHGLARLIQSFVARARTGHIITEEYLHRFTYL